MYIIWAFIIQSIRYERGLRRRRKSGKALEKSPLDPFPFVLFIFSGRGPFFDLWGGTAPRLHNKAAIPSRKPLFERGPNGELRSYFFSAQNII